MPRISKIIFKRQFDGLTVPGVATYFKARIVNEMLYLEKDKQKHRIESPEMNPHFYIQLTFDRGGKYKQWTKDSLFSKWYWENWTDTCREMKLDQLFTPHTRINSNQIKDLNVGLEAIKILEENIGSKISDIAHSNIFADISTQARGTKEKINNGTTSNYKVFCKAKETINKMKR